MKTNTKIKLKKIFLLLASPFFFAMFFVFSIEAKAGESAVIEKGDVVINEIQVSGGTGKTTQEFIELYNSTERDIELVGFSLKKKTKAQITPPGALLDAADFAGIIPSRGYFLISHPDFKEAIIADLAYSVNLSGTFPSIAGDNTILLYDKDGILLDKVGYGSAQDYEKFPAPSISDKKSIERRNFQDTDNNEDDFTVLEVATPLNSFYLPDSGDEDEDGQDEEDNQATPICTDKVVLNEIFPFTEEFVEVYNEGEEKCNLDEWSISDKLGNADNNTHRKYFENVELDAGDYTVLAGGLNLNDDGDEVKLYNAQNVEVQKVSYAKTTDKNKSYSFKGEDWEWTEFLTKGGQNKFEEKTSAIPLSELKTYPTGISITELFPNPFQSQYEEYIELYNGTEEDVDLEGWMLRDVSKTGKYIFGESVILKSKKYLAIFKEKFKFALNNSGNESVTLFDPNGKEVSKVEYNGSKKNTSLNLDGLRWRGSKFLTPGAENILNNEPYGKVKIDDDIFLNAYADFSVSTGDKDGEKVKVIWDFGDNHKSYLAKTRHKYKAIGKYQASVKLSDGNEDVIKNFEIEVKKFPHPKVKIISFTANPIGKDSEMEIIVIENKSKKKINLQGWSVATGTKNLVNHPITEKFEIKKKQSKEITREISKFTLNNRKGKIELRYPDGKVADKIKYDHGKNSIGDDEVYTKESGKWEWEESQKFIKSVKSIKQNTEEMDQIQEENSDGEVAGVEIVKIKNTFVMLENDVVIGKIEISDDELRAMEIENVREVDGQYILTAQGKDSQHYAIIFFKNISSDINLKLNSLLNFSKQVLK